MECYERSTGRDFVEESMGFGSVDGRLLSLLPCGKRAERAADGDEMRWLREEGRAAECLGPEQEPADCDCDGCGTLDREGIHDATDQVRVHGTLVWPCCDEVNADRLSELQFHRSPQ
jgi:hypothetical protein